MFSDSQTEIRTKECTNRESHRVMENITGPLAVFSKEISRMGSEAVKVCGRRAREEATSMKESGSTIKSKAMESLPGLMGISTKGTM